MEDKFANIKVGDNVFITEQVVYGFGRGRRFNISTEVTKVTNTQFTVNTGGRYNKNGRIIKRGSYMRAYKYNEYLNGNLIVDQTKEMNQFKRKLSMEIYISNKLTSFKMTLNSDLSNKELNKIYKLVNELETKLNNK